MTVFVLREVLQIVLDVNGNPSTVPFITLSTMTVFIKGTKEIVKSFL